MKRTGEKIRILQSLESLQIGGNEVFVMNVFRHINKEKFRVDFVIYDDAKMDFYDEIISEGSKVYICKSNIKNRYLNIIANILKLRKILINNEYDVIHCNGCSFMGIFRGVIAAYHINNIKIISHSHNSGIQKNNFVDNLLRNLLKKFLCSVVDLGFACSDIAAESKYTAAFMKTSKFAIINNSIDIDKFLFNKDIREKMRSKFEIKDEIVIGNIGRLEEQKNQIFLLRIFAEIKKRNISAKLIIIGDGCLYNDLKEYTVKNKIENDVIFTGKVLDSNNYYQMMDVFVLTSIYEGFPFVMVEAQANGLPAVVSNTISKTVNISGDVEFICLDKNEKEWADVILEKKRKYYENDVYKHICREYDLKYKVKSLEKYYEELIKE